MVRLTDEMLRLTGRAPWLLEDALKQYGKWPLSVPMRVQVLFLLGGGLDSNFFGSGDVFRIAPNELLFVRPQALAGKHSPFGLII